MQNMSLDIYRKISKANEILDKVDRRNMQIEVLSDVNVFLAMVEICHKRHFITSHTMSIWTKKTMDVKYLTAAWLKKT